VVVPEHEAPDLAALGLALGAPLGAHDARHFGRNHVAIRVHGHEEAAPFERKTDAAPGGRRPHRAAQPERLALEIQKLLGVDLAADLLHRREQLALERRKLLHLARQPLGIAEHLPRRLETERERRGRRTAEVVRRDAARDVGVRLIQHRAHAARVLAFPRLDVQEERDRQEQLDAGAAPAHVHDATRDERLDRGRQAARGEDAARLRDAIQELPRRPRQDGRVTQLRELEQ
jgi:hypothetical protein